MNKSIGMPAQRQLSQEEVEFLANVHDMATEAIYNYLDGYKNRRGMEGLEVEAFKQALFVMASTLVSNGLVLDTPTTDNIISLSIQGISQGAVAAKKKVEDKRIILLS